MANEELAGNFAGTESDTVLPMPVADPSATGKGTLYPIVVTWFWMWDKYWRTKQWDLSGTYEVVEDAGPTTIISTTYSASWYTNQRDEHVSGGTQWAIHQKAAGQISNYQLFNIETERPLHKTTGADGFVFDILEDFSRDSASDGLLITQLSGTVWRPQLLFYDAQYSSTGSTSVLVSTLEDHEVDIYNTDTLSFDTVTASNEIGTFTFEGETVTYYSNLDPADYTITWDPTFAQVRY